MVRERLSDEQWERIESLLPGKPGDPGRTGVNNRKTIEGIVWILRTGAPWRDLPAEFGKWGTVYQRFRRWSNAGIFDRIFETTQGEVDLRATQVDGTFVKAHQHASGAPKADARPTHPEKPRASERVEAG